jgi:hypothetical protein
MKKSLVAVAALCIALGLAGPAPAATTNEPGWTNYVGKTKEGGPISFAYRKGRIAILDARIHTSCGSPLTGGNRHAYNVYFDPPDRAWFWANGKEDQLKVTQPSPTKWYTVRARRVGKRMVGSLRLSYSLLTTGTWGDFYILTCVGTARFDLRPSR